MKFLFYKSFKLMFMWLRYTWVTIDPCFSYLDMYILFTILVLHTFLVFPYFSQLFLDILIFNWYSSDFCCYARKIYWNVCSVIYFIITYWCWTISILTFIYILHALIFGQNADDIASNSIVNFENEFLSRRSKLATLRLL